jgi:8-oxo-dGTP pyrophosphatase MutT (NUDIX family)
MLRSAGIIIVRKVERQWLYLFLRAYNYWDFPKGEEEQGETSFETAKREVTEETGLHDLSFRWGRIFKETEPYNNGKKTARYYLAETSESKVRFSMNPEIGGPEHHEYRWLNSTELKKLAVKRLQPIIDWARDVIES